MKIFTEAKNYHEIDFALKKSRNPYGEYVVKAFKNGKFDEDATYYTDDWDDAEATFMSLVDQYDLSFRTLSDGYTTKPSLNTTPSRRINRWTSENTTEGYYPDTGKFIIFSDSDVPVASATNEVEAEELASRYNGYYTKEKDTTIKEATDAEPMYKLVTYKLSGVDKGKRDKEEFFTDRESVSKRYHELFRKELRSYNPTVWKKCKNGWCRIVSFEGENEYVNGEDSLNESSAYLPYALKDKNGEVVSVVKSADKNEACRYFKSTKMFYPNSTVEETTEEVFDEFTK